MRLYCYTCRVSNRSCGQIVQHASMAKSRIVYTIPCSRPDLVPMSRHVYIKLARGEIGFFT